MGGQGFGRLSKTVPGFESDARRHVAKVGRNARCPCGTGKKYKDCHEREGTAFLEKLARDRDRKLQKQQGVPWYRRLFSDL